METLEKRTMDFEYRDYLTTVDRDGVTLYYKPNSPNALYTKDALPKSAKITATLMKAPVKVAPVKVQLKPIPTPSTIPITVGQGGTFKFKDEPPRSVKITPAIKFYQEQHIKAKAILTDCKKSDIETSKGMVNQNPSVATFNALSAEKNAFADLKKEVMTAPKINSK